MEKSIGALWVVNGNKGEYWKGNIELPDGTKKNVIVFKNSYKKDNQPDFRIYEARQKEGKQEENQFEITDSSDLPF